MSQATYVKGLCDTMRDGQTYGWMDEWIELPKSIIPRFLASRSKFSQAESVSMEFNLRYIITCRRVDIALMLNSANAYVWHSHEYEYPECIPDLVIV